MAAAKQNAPGEDDECGGPEGTRSRPDDDKNTDDASGDGHQAGRRKVFPKERSREEGYPDGGGEFNSRHDCQRRERNTPHPGILAGKVDDVPHDVQSQSSCGEGAYAESRSKQDQDQERDGAAQKQDLDGSHVAAELARGHRHEDERRNDGFGPLLSAFSNRGCRRRHKHSVKD
jgi:hypothetical protein